MPFGFIVLSSGRVATEAVSNYLNLHPELLVTKYHDTDPMLVGGDVRGVAEMGGGAKTGLLVHDRQAVDAAAAHMDELIDGGRMVQMVRDPVKHLVSVYNHLVHRCLLEMCEDPGSFEDYLRDEARLNMSRYFRMQEPFLERFAEPYVVDFSQMGEGGVYETMVGVYGYLGVDGSFSHSSFSVKQQTDAAFCMRHRPCVIEVDGVELKLLMKYEGDFCWTGYEAAVYKQPSIAGAVPFAMEDRDLIFWAHTATWEGIPEATRQGLLDNGRLGRALTGYLQSWCGWVADVDERYKKRRVDGAGEAETARVKEALRGDVGEMLKRYPHLEGCWGY